MSPQHIILAVFTSAFVSTLATFYWCEFGKGGYRATSTQLKAEQEISERYCSILDAHKKECPLFASAAGEGGASAESGPTVNSARTASTWSIDAELRAAAKAERDEWDGKDNLRLYPRSSAIHLALAELLEHIADDICDSDATEVTLSDEPGRYYTLVHPRDSQGRLRETRFDWRAALECARMINGGSLLLMSQAELVSQKAKTGGDR